MYFVPVVKRCAVQDEIYFCLINDVRIGDSNSFHFDSHFQFFSVRSIEFHPRKKSQNLIQKAQGISQTSALQAAYF